MAVYTALFSGALKKISTVSTTVFVYEKRENSQFILEITTRIVEHAISTIVKSTKNTKNIINKNLELSLFSCKKYSKNHFSFLSVWSNFVVKFYAAETYIDYTLYCVVLIVPTETIIDNI